MHPWDELERAVARDREVTGLVKLIKEGRYAAPSRRRLLPTWWFSGALCGLLGIASYNVVPAVLPTAPRHASVTVQGTLITHVSHWPCEIISCSVRDGGIASSCQEICVLP